MEKPTLISLYSGCGGSALGFQNAGFEIRVGFSMLLV
jgi:site-specific DNA-cytosine methylase